MSQRNEKLRRQVEALKGRMDAMENNAAAWYAAETTVHNKAIMDATAERNAERRCARQAERTARIWKHIAYAALVAAIIVEIIAICAIWAAGADAVSAPPVTTAAPEVRTISSICDISPTIPAASSEK